MKIYDWIEQVKKRPDAGDLFSTYPIQSEFKNLSQEKKDTCLNKVFEDILDRINQVYIAGSLEFIAKSEKFLYRIYLSTEDTLNSTWLACLEDKELLSSFSDIAEQYCSQLMTGVQRYKRHLARMLAHPAQRMATKPRNLNASLLKQGTSAGMADAKAGLPLGSFHQSTALTPSTTKEKGKQAVD